MNPTTAGNRIRFWLLLFIAGLTISGLTAFPLQLEINALASFLGVPPTPVPDESSLHTWIRTIQHALDETYTRYPFFGYGTDWLAFGHLVIALFFVGPLIDPVRNKWVITAGLIACAGVIPLALIAGHVRGIPIGWRVIDCSFGVFGAIPLLICRRHIRKLEQLASDDASEK